MVLKRLGEIFCCCFGVNHKLLYPFLFFFVVFGGVTSLWEEDDLVDLFVVHGFFYNTKFR